MPLRIAFDMDGVFADMERALDREAEAVFGEAAVRKLRDRHVATPTEPAPVPQAGAQTPETPAAAEPAEPVERFEPPVRGLMLTARQQRKLWRHVESLENFWVGLSEIEPGIVERLAVLAADRRWEVIFLTKRPQTAGAPAQIQTQRWLESHGFPLPSVYVVQGSRGKIAAALDLDVVVDDRPENCLDVVVDSKARAILVWREDQQLLPSAARRLGIGAVKSVAECLDILAQIAPPETEPLGVKERVMRLLGLKAQPAQA